MKFPCPYGHMESDSDGTPRKKVHKSRRDCDIYNRLMASGKVDYLGRFKQGYSLEQLRSEEAAPATAPASTEPPKQSLGEKIAEKIKKAGSGFSVAYTEVSTTPPADPSLIAGSNDWLVSEDTSVAFANFILGMIGIMCNGLCMILDIERMPDNWFVCDPGQAFVFKTTLRGWTTGVLRNTFKAKTPEEADRTVAGLSGILGFGTTGVKIVGHLLKHAPNSPRLKAWRVRRAEAMRLRKLREQEQAAREAQGKNDRPTLPGGRPA